MINFDKYRTNGGTYIIPCEILDEFIEVNEILKSNCGYYITVIEEKEIIINELQQENKQLKDRIDKAIELISNWSQEYNGLMKTNNIYIPEDKQDLFDLRKILKGDNNE